MDYKIQMMNDIWALWMGLVHREREETTRPCGTFCGFCGRQCYRFNDINELIVCGTMLWRESLAVRLRLQYDTSLHKN